MHTWTSYSYQANSGPPAWLIFSEPLFIFLNEFSVYFWVNGTKLGTLIVKVSCDPNVCPESNFKVFVKASFPNSPVELVFNVVTTNPIIGQPITIEARLQDTSGANVNPLKILSVVMRIIQGDGTVTTKVVDVLINNSIIGKCIPNFSDQQKAK